MLKRRLKLKTAVIVTVAGLVLLAGLAVGAVRVLDLVAPSYRMQVAAQIAERINQPVRVGALDLGWDWHGPVLRLQRTAILDAPGGKAVIRANTLALHFEFWSLLRGQLQPHGVSVAGPRVSAYRDAQGDIRLRGLLASDSKTDWQALAQKLNNFDFIRVSDGQITWRPNPDSTHTLQLVAVGGALRNDDHNHRLHAQLRLPDKLGSEVSLSASLQGDVKAPKTWRAHAYLNGQRLDFAALAHATGLDFTAPRIGRNDVQIWGDWRNGKVSNTRATLTGRTANNSADPLLQANAAMDLSLIPAQPGYQLRLDAVRGDNRYPAQAGGVINIQPQGKTLHGELHDLPASLLGIAAAYLTPDAGWHIGGQLKQVNLTYNGDKQPAVFAATTDFEQLEARNSGNGMHISGLNGKLHIARDSGSLNLRAANGTFSWPSHVQGEFPLDTLEGDIDWQKNGDDWHVHAIDMRWLGADAVVSGGGNITLPPQALPTVDISAKIQALDMPRLLAFLPQDPDLPNPRLREWLATAVRAGKMPNATLRLQGPLKAFPFAQGGGTFKVHADIADATLDYKPEWPALTQGQGEFTLEGDTLTVDAKSARMLDVNVGPATASINDVREPILKINGQVTNAKAASLLNFLPNSPLQDKFGRLAQVLDISGQADLALKMSLPLKHELGKDEVQGRIALKQVSLQHKALPAPIKDIRGDINFNLKGLSAKDLHGTLMSLPLIVDLSPAQGGSLDIDASTLLRLPRDAQALQRFVPAAVVKRVSGEGVWHALLQVDPTGKASDLALRSDLKGFTLDFGAPLAKPADDTLPIRVEVGAGHNRIHIDLADRLDMVIDSLNGHVYRVNMDFGDTGVAAPDGRGVWLGGRIAKLDALPWQQFIHELGQSQDKDKTSSSDSPGLNLRGADLNIDQTRFSGQHLDQIQFNMTPLGAGKGWQAKVSGVGATGQVKWLEAPANTAGARALLSGHFDQMVLEPDEHEANPPETDIADSTSPFNPAQLPVIDLSIDKLSLNGHDFGRFTLNASAIIGGIRLDKLNLSDGRLNMDASGKWWQQDNLTQAQLKANIKGKGFEVLFRTLGYTPSVRADKTEIHADLNVAPNPHGLAPAALNGTLSFKFDDGSLLTVDPGAGRILGLFNFYALPRRLLLNFSDVVDKGLGFDKIRGKFNIESGIAHTNNLRVKTPSSLISTKGQVDLVNRSYDQHVTIAPKLSSSVAVAGTLLGGPAVGAVLLVAQKLLEKPISKLASISYHLTGNWQDPKIETVTAIEKEPDDTPTNKEPSKNNNSEKTEKPDTK